MKPRWLLILPVASVAVLVGISYGAEYYNDLKEKQAIEDQGKEWIAKFKRGGVQNCSSVRIADEHGARTMYVIYEVYEGNVLIVDEDERQTLLSFKTPAKFAGIHDIQVRGSFAEELCRTLRGIEAKAA